MLRYCPRCGTQSDATTCELDGTPTVRQGGMGLGKLGEGDVVGGRYRLCGELGRGGFGVVFDAVHTTTGHPVAIKILTPSNGQEGQELARRFFHEAATTSRLSHPNTVRVFDFGQTEAGDLFLAMERLSGETLQSRLNALVAEDRVMSEAEAVETGVSVLRSLGEAHALGLVHRDMKPANVFLHAMPGGDSIIKVLDFGIVKDNVITMTQTGKALGTPTHMSPEQAMGRPVDGRSDLYSLGVVLYECLTGTLPFWGDSPLTVVMKHVSEPVPPIATRVPGRVRRQLAEVVEKAMAKKADDRWQTALDMRNALQESLSEGALPALPASVRVVAQVPRAPAPAPVSTPAPQASQRRFPGLDGPEAPPPPSVPAAVVAAAPPPPFLPNTTQLDESASFGPWVQLQQEQVESAQAEAQAVAAPQQNHLQTLQQMTRAMPVRPPQVPAQQLISALWLSDDGRRALYGDLSCTVRGVDLSGLGEQALSLTELPQQAEIGRHSARIIAVAGSPDGRLVTSASTDGVVRVWDAAAGSLVSEAPLQSAVTCLAAANDGKLIVVGCEDGSAWLLEFPQLTVRRTLHGHRDALTAVAAAGSRRLVVTAGVQGTIRTWDPVGGGARLTFRGHEGAVGAVAVAQTAQGLASAGLDGNVLVWSARTGELLRRIQAHAGAITGLSIDRDARIGATASEDCKARVWNLETGDLLAERQDFRSPARFVHLLSDDGAAIAGSWDGTLRRLAW